MSSKCEGFEEAEPLVYVDFGSSLLPSDLDNPNLDIKMIGVETDSPIIEVNGKLFKGTYQFSVGTDIFLEKDKSVKPLDPLFDVNPREMYKIAAKTSKVLTMKRLFVESKSAEAGQDKEESFQELRSRLEVNMSYGEALNLLLSPGKTPPRKFCISNKDLNGSSDSSSDTNDDPDYVPDT